MANLERDAVLKYLSEHKFDGDGLKAEESLTKLEIMAEIVINGNADKILNNLYLEAASKVESVMVK